MLSFYVLLHSDAHNLTGKLFEVSIKCYCLYRFTYLACSQKQVIFEGVSIRITQEQLFMLNIKLAIKKKGLILTATNKQYLWT